MEEEVVVGQGRRRKTKYFGVRICMVEISVTDDGRGIVAGALEKEYNFGVV